MAAPPSAKALTIAAIALSLLALGVTLAIPGPQGPKGDQGPVSITYNPTPQQRKIYLVVVPDLAGEGYDDFVSQTIVVNQGDNVSITIRNTDEMEHGFFLPDYNIDVQLPAAQNVTGTLEPSVTVIPTFTATKAGVFMFYCTVPCGEGHLEMIGYFNVLPRS